ncbi:MAG: malate permease [Verrucomicrobiota bacterium]|jgi:predicted permease|nr:malate permease [Verrucomicrobiota bacterium]
MNYILQILFILALMALGWLARRRKMISETGTAEMTRLLVSVIYPALIFYSITRLNPGQLARNWIMPIMTIVIAGIGLALGLLTLRWLKPADPKRTEAFLFQSTINNYLFLPLPLVMLLWGAEGVALLVFASMGFELTVWTVGVFLFNRSNRFSDGLRVMFGPPLIALIVSVIWICVRDLSPLRLPDNALLNRLFDLLYFGAEVVGRATVALSMIVAGSRISALSAKSINDLHVWIVSTLRLIVAPVLFILLLNQLPMEELARNILTVVAVMPAAVASLIFSERFSGDTDFIAATLLVTHLGAVVTVPLLLAWAL